MPRKNKQEKAEHERQYYLSHMEEAKVKMRKRYEADPAYFIESAARRRQEVKEFLQQQRVGLYCNRCGNDDFRVLDFHHLDRNSKDGSVSTMLTRKWSKERILQEIAKCEVLCANCHRILHWEERNADASSVRCNAVLV